MNFIAYYRVSTDQQGRSGLGLDAQKQDVSQWLNGRQLSAEFTEVESGAKSNRPELEKALALCRKTKATLVIAKLDRLARKVSFISSLMDRKVKFVACDLPNVSPFMLHIYAAVAEEERRMISQRTKAALAQAKARGVKLGSNGVNLAKANKSAAKDRAEAIRPEVERLRLAGITSANGIALALGRHPQSIARLLRRLA